ncbi:MAG TPA: hypothetical protein VGD87_07340, partial [Archangium sp.]
EGPMSTEARLWSGQDVDKSLEIRASDIEQRMGELAASEQAEKEEGAEHLGEQREKQEKAEKKGLFKVFAWNQKQGTQAQTAKTLAQRQAEAKTRQQELQKARVGSAFGQPTTSTSQSKLQPVGTHISASRLQAVQKAMLSGQSATNERPPDAFALLKDARERGVLFVEDALADGHSEDQEDPELAAAVEECIAQCFGVRGILRIGPGHNDKNEPIIVVATTHGFTDASLAKVPEKVHRFATLIAIPFDLLPLKRER